ncbi:MAG: PPC domain-containing DNA-binding protein [Candidatus Omnitrophota bacterium]
MEVVKGRTFIGRLPARNDLYGSLTEVCHRYQIRLGVFSVIGAVKNLVLGYYDQTRQKYIQNVDLKGDFEILSCLGNISLKDNNIFVHAHIAAGARDGSAFGGHLMPGTTIFAAEYHIQELAGGELHRQPDSETGLSLWQKEN